MVDILSPIGERWVTTDDFLDAFGRIRVSDPITLFDSTFRYDLAPNVWESVLSGAGTVTHDADGSCVVLTAGTVSGDSAIRQTFQYFKYQPGKSQLILLTGILGSAKANVTQRIGYYDNANGLFFEQTGSGLSVVRRSSVTGSPVDTKVGQGNWNLNAMNGNDYGGVNLDTSKAQIFLIDLEWLGVGRVRFGFVIDGKIYYCHEMTHANELAAVYMSSATLPVRYEIVNTANTASATSMKQICQSVISEGGVEEQRGIVHAVGTGATLVNITTRQSVLAIRPKATFNSVANRIGIFPETFDIYCGANGVYYEVVWRGTMGGTVAWTSAGTNSAFEYRSDQQTVTGGEVIAAGYVPATNQARNTIAEAIKSRIPLTLDYAGTTAYELAIVATSLSGTATAGAVIEAREAF